MCASLSLRISMKAGILQSLCSKAGTRANIHATHLSCQNPHTMISTTDQLYPNTKYAQKDYQRFVSKDVKALVVMLENKHPEPNRKEFRNLLYLKMLFICSISSSCHPSASWNRTLASSSASSSSSLSFCRTLRWRANSAAFSRRAVGHF